MKFRVLSLQERVSRLEELVSELGDRLTVVVRNESAIFSSTGDVATEFRSCDDEPLVKNKAGSYRALFDDGFSLIGNECVIVAWNGGERLGFFGVDLTGQFFVVKCDSVNGEKLVFGCDDTGLLIRDQNGNLGRVEVDVNGFLKFVPV